MRARRGRRQLRSAARMHSSPSTSILSTQRPGQRLGACRARLSGLRRHQVGRCAATLGGLGELALAQRQRGALRGELSGARALPLLAVRRQRVRRGDAALAAGSRVGRHLDVRGRRGGLGAGASLFSGLQRTLLAGRARGWWRSARPRRCGSCDSGNGCDIQPRSRWMNMPDAQIVDVDRGRHDPAVFHRPDGLACASLRQRDRELEPCERHCESPQPASMLAQHAGHNARERRLSTLDARGQHDRRRGALDAVERADAVDQRVELADRRARRRWRSGRTAR